MSDMHTPYPNIEEDTKFSKVLIVKQKLEKLSESLRIDFYSSVWTLETNTF
jgi:hypothetical protein